MNTLDKIAARHGDEIMRRIDQIKERNEKKEAARAAEKLTGQTAAQGIAAEIIQLRRRKNQRF